MALLTGLPIVEGDIDRSERLAMDVAGRFGRVLPQDRQANHSYLVRDEGHVTGMGAGKLVSRVASSSKSRERLDLHNDAAPRWVTDEPIDVVVLLAIRPAEIGGETILVSARAVYDAILEEDAAAAKILRSPFTFDRSAEGTPAAEAQSTGPVFEIDDDWFAARCNRFRIETAAQDIGRPLNKDQLRALDLLDSVLDREEFRLRLTLQPGECLILDDRVVVHARTAFEDPRRQRDGRCLVRVWVRRGDKTRRPDASAHSAGVGPR